MLIGQSRHGRLIGDAESELDARPVQPDFGMGRQVDDGDHLAEDIQHLVLREHTLAHLDFLPLPHPPLHRLHLVDVVALAPAAFAEVLFAAFAGVAVGGFTRKIPMRERDSCVFGSIGIESSRFQRRPFRFGQPLPEPLVFVIDWHRCSRAERTGLPPWWRPRA